MELNELMIGDWVSYKGKMYCKITAICKDTAVVDNDTEQDWRIDYNKLIPIPLTAEILEKNGFTFKKHTYFLKKEGHYWINEEGNIFIKYGKKSADKIDSWMINVDNENGYPVCCFDIFYVHEFQHALKLCGIEKEIEL